jgi:nucleoid DNA-binding protein
MITKPKFAKRISKKTGMSVNEVEIFWELIIKEMAEVLKSGDSLYMSDFGVLTLRRKRPRFNGVYKKFSQERMAAFFRPAKNLIKELDKLNPDNFHIGSTGFIMDKPFEGDIRKRLKMDERKADKE